MKGIIKNRTLLLGVLTLLCAVFLCLGLLPTRQGSSARADTMVSDVIADEAFDFTFTDTTFFGGDKVTVDPISRTMQTSGVVPGKVLFEDYHTRFLATFTSEKFRFVLREGGALTAVGDNFLNTEGVPSLWIEVSDEKIELAGVSGAYASFAFASASGAVKDGGTGFADNTERFFELEVENRENLNVAVRFKVNSETAIDFVTTDGAQLPRAAFSLDGSADFVGFSSKASAEAYVLDRGFYGWNWISRDDGNGARPKILSIDFGKDSLRFGRAGGDTENDNGQGGNGTALVSEAQLGSYSFAMNVKADASECKDGKKLELFLRQGYEDGGWLDTKAWPLFYPHHSNGYSFVADQADENSRFSLFKYVDGARQPDLTSFTLPIAEFNLFDGETHSIYASVVNLPGGDDTAMTVVVDGTTVVDFSTQSETDGKDFCMTRGFFQLYTSQATMEFTQPYRSKDAVPEIFDLPAPGSGVSVDEAGTITMKRGDFANPGPAGEGTDNQIDGRQSYTGFDARFRLKPQLIDGTKAGAKITISLRNDDFSPKDSNDSGYNLVFWKQETNNDAVFYLFKDGVDEIGAIKGYNFYLTDFFDGREQQVEIYFRPSVDNQNFDVLLFVNEIPALYSSLSRGVHGDGEMNVAKGAFDIHISEIETLEISDFAVKAMPYGGDYKGDLAADYAASVAQARTGAQEKLAAVRPDAGFLFDEERAAFSELSGALEGAQSFGAIKSAYYEALRFDFHTDIRATDGKDGKYRFGDSLEATVNLVKRSGALGAEVPLASEGTEGYTVSGFDGNVIGKQTVTATYLERTFSWEISVFDMITGITVTDNRQGNYVYFDNLDLSVIPTTQSGAAASDVFAFCTVAYDKTVLEEQTVTVSYVDSQEKTHTASFELTLGKRMLTPALSGHENLVYDGQDKTVELTLEGIPEDALPATVTFTIEKAGTAVGAVRGAGGYRLVPVLDSNVYVLASDADLSFEVDKRELTVRFENYSDKEYSGAAQSVSATFAGVAEGDEITAALSYTRGGAAVTEVRAVGDYVATAGLPQAFAADYRVKGETVLFSVAPKSIALSLSGTSGLVYDGAEKTLGIVAEGVLKADKVTLSLVYQRNGAAATAVKNAGTYVVTIQISGADVGNYDFKGEREARFLVEKAQVGVTSHPTYDADAVVIGKALPALTGGAASAEGAFVWSPANPSAERGKKTYYYLFRPTDAENYASDFTGYFSITAGEGSVVSLEITAPASKLSYFVGDALTLEGLQVKATYESGKTQTFAVTAEMTNAAAIDMATAGEKTVQITFGGKQAQFAVQVRTDGVVSVAIETPASVLTYLTGDSVDLSGLEILVTYDSGRTEKISVTAAMTDAGTADMTTAGDKTITVTYGGKTVTYKVTVEKKKGGCNSSTAKAAAPLTGLLLLTGTVGILKKRRF